LVPFKRVLSVQARPVLFARVQGYLRDYKVNTCAFQYVSGPLPRSRSVHNARSAICAFLILFATFVVGLRCFRDFDKGLKPSKVHGQSLLPTSNAEKINLIGEYFFFSLDTQTSIQHPNHQGSIPRPRPAKVISGEHHYRQGFLLSEDLLNTSCRLAFWGFIGVVMYDPPFSLTLFDPSYSSFYSFYMFIFLLVIQRDTSATITFFLR